MAQDPSIFSYAYAVEVDSNGNFVIADTDPAEQDLRIKDDVDDGPTDRHAVVGDTANDQFHVSGAGALNGLYTFTSLATTGGASGFIAYNEATGTYYFLTNDAVSPSETALTETAGVLQVCFMPGTMIATPAGERAVEDLAIGDLVLTSEGRHAPVRWIGRQSVAPLFADELTLPVRVRAGALGENLPARDLLVSPDHALLVDGILAHAGALVNGVSILRETRVPPMFVYYHVELDDHSLLFADGAAAETFIDNVDRMRFDNYAEYEALYPEDRAIVEMALPRAKSHRQVPPAIRDRLYRRALDLFGELAVAA
ncbi:MAG: Hint domain-containing protein [Rhizobiales bacterium]|nr:Hint domain-containing protein [Hyphomicrobiales bacterium]